MDKMRKITVRVPKVLLEQLQASTGQGITATVREALKVLVSFHEQGLSRNAQRILKP